MLLPHRMQAFLHRQQPDLQQLTEPCTVGWGLDLLAATMVIVGKIFFLIRLLRAISSVQKPPSRADFFRMARAARSYAFDLFCPAMVFGADCFGAVLRSRFGGAGAAATDS